MEEEQDGEDGERDLHPRDGALPADLPVTPLTRKRNGFPAYS